MLADEGDDLGDIVGGAQQVHFIDDEDDLLAPGADAVQEGALGLGEGAVGGGDEEDEVAAGDELSGELLVVAQDGVGAGGIHDGDVAQEGGGMGDLFDAVGAQACGGGLAVAQDGDAGGGGGDAFGKHRLADEGVDEGGFAGVELTGDDEQEGFFEGLGGAAQRLGVLGGGLEGAQAGAKRLGEAALVGENLDFALAEDGG
ncbi:MAG TPA: hypothetical protein VIR81_02250 [Myxococcales bacterium]